MYYLIAVMVAQEVCNAIGADTFDLIEFTRAIVGDTRGDLNASGVPDLNGVSALKGAHDICNTYWQQTTVFLKKHIGRPIVYDDPSRLTYVLP